MSQQTQPSGVVIAAMIHFLEGILWVALGLTGLMGVLGALLSYLGGTGIALVPLILGIVLLIIGWGLWTLQDWARIAAIIASVLVLLGSLGGGIWSAMVVAAVFPFVGLPALVLLIAHAWMIYYLLQPDVAAAFGISGGRGAMIVQQEQWKVSIQAQVPPPQPAPSAGPLTRTSLIGQPSPVVAWLVVKSGPYAGQQYRLEVSTTLGRDGSRCHFVVDDDAVSKEHAKINFERGQFVIYDLGSTNGTFLNNARIQRQMLMDGDILRLGNTTLVFKRA